MTFGSSRCWLSQSVETSQRLASFSSGMISSKSPLRIILSENRYPSPIKSGTGFFGMIRSRKRNPHPAVLFALLLDLRHADRAALAGAAHMRAAARLQVQSDDLDQPHLAGADRRLHRHGLHESGISFEFFIGDPA